MVVSFSEGRGDGGAVGIKCSVLGKLHLRFLLDIQVETLRKLLGIQVQNQKRSQV